MVVNGKEALNLPLGAGVNHVEGCPEIFGHLQQYTSVRTHM